LPQLADVHEPWVATLSVDELPGPSPEPTVRVFAAQAPPVTPAAAMRNGANRLLDRRVCMTNSPEVVTLF
jgi:hypothetical protein